MPLLLLLSLVLFVIVLFWITAKIVGVIITVVIAGLVGALADSVVSGDRPFGWLGAILAGLLGSWIGVFLFDRLGIGTGIFIADIPIIPAFVGAVILAFIVSLLHHRTARGRII